MNKRQRKEFLEKHGIEYIPPWKAFWITLLTTIKELYHGKF